MQDIVQRDGALPGVLAKPKGVLKGILESRAAEVALFAAAAVVVVSTAANAGADATFNPTVTTITNWTEGSLGKLAGVAGVAGALIGMVLKFDWRLIGGAAAIGLTASTGPDIVSSLASAVF